MRMGWLAGLTLAAALAAPAEAQIKVGVSGPITGSDAAFGAQLRNGAEQAVADINAAGGILGQKIAATFGDDAGDPRQGVSVANKFASEGVKWVVGHFNSGVSIPASDVYSENGIVQITPASTNEKLTDRVLDDGRGKPRPDLLVFRTCGRDDQQGAVAGNYLVQHFKGKKLAIVHDKTPYGKGLADNTKLTVNKAGLQELVYEGINKGEKDFSALISKLKQAGVDIVYFGGLHTEAGLIIRQMRDQGLRAPLMSGDGITDKEFVQVAGPGAEGTYMTFGPDARKNPEAAEVVARFRARNIDPEAYTLYSYAAVQVLKQAAEAAKSTDGKKIADVMRSGMVFKTVIGDISYDKKGDITRVDYVMYVWKKGSDGKIDYAGNEVSM